MALRMKVYQAIIITALILITGCATVTTVIEPNGDEWKISSKDNAVVTLERIGKFKLTVNNQGKMGVVESIVGALIIKTDVNLSNKEGISR